MFRPESTPIYNEILEKLGISRISGQEYRVILVVIRQTFGWQDPKTTHRKTSDWISYSQFEEKTGMDHSNVGKILRRLIEKKILLKMKLAI